MSNPLSPLTRAIQDEVAKSRRVGRHASVVVSARVGTMVEVYEPGDETHTGLYHTAPGVAARIRVGDMVTLDTGSLLVFPFSEGGELFNGMARVGEDLSVGTTTSVSDYVTLLDVDGLAIPADSAMELFWSTESVAVGGIGSAGKQVRVVLNDEAGIDLTFGTGSHIQSAERAFITPMAAGFDSPARIVAGQVGSWIYASAEGEINRVRLQGKTNDSEESNDILRGQGLAVFA